MGPRLTLEAYYGDGDGGCLAPGFSAITFSRIFDSQSWGPKENKMV
jgi:hypothetical protein